VDLASRGSARAELLTYRGPLSGNNQDETAHEVSPRIRSMLSFQLSVAGNHRRPNQLVEADSYSYIRVNY